MPSQSPTLLDTVPDMTTMPNLQQTVFPIVSPANTVHTTTTWKCDAASAEAAQSFPGLASELAYGYAVMGHPTPYCVPLPEEAPMSVMDSKFLQAAYVMKKEEQALWAEYY